MDQVIAFLVAGWLLTGGGGSTQTAVKCEVGVIPSRSGVVRVYECLVRIGDSNFVLTGMVYPVEEGLHRRIIPEVESY